MLSSRGVARAIRLTRVLGSGSVTRMPDETEVSRWAVVGGMRVSITLTSEDTDRLVQLMARMDPRGEDGRPRAITPTDALREALRLASTGR